MLLYSRHVLLALLTWLSTVHCIMKSIITIPLKWLRTFDKDVLRGILALRRIYLDDRTLGVMVV